MKVFCKDKDNYIIFSNQHQNQHLFDSWSFIHVNNMLITFIILDTFLNKRNALLLSLILCVFFEIVENSSIGHYFMKKAGYPKYRGDTLINVIGDIICDLIGIYIGYNISFFNFNKKMLYLSSIFILLEIIPYYLSNEGVIYSWINLLKNINKN